MSLSKSENETFSENTCSNVIRIIMTKIPGVLEGKIKTFSGGTCPHAPRITRLWRSLHTFGVPSYKGVQPPFRNPITELVQSSI